MEEERRIKVHRDDAEEFREFLKTEEVEFKDVVELSESQFLEFLLASATAIEVVLKVSEYSKKLAEKRKNSMKK